jgi:hypothetical protein
MVGRSSLAEYGAQAWQLYRTTTRANLHDFDDCMNQAAPADSYSEPAWHGLVSLAKRANSANVLDEAEVLFSRTARDWSACHATFMVQDTSPKAAVHARSTTTRSATDPAAR